MRSISRQKIRQRVAIQIGARVGKRIEVCVAAPIDTQLWMHSSLVVWPADGSVWKQILGKNEIQIKSHIVRPIYQQAKGDCNG